MAVDLTTTATIPASTGIDITVYEDLSNDGTTDNSETVSISGGTNTYTLSTLTGAANAAYWFKVDFSTTDKTASAELASATLDVPTTATSTVTPTTATGTPGTVTPTMRLYSNAAKTGASGSPAASTPFTEAESAVNVTAAVSATLLSAPFTTNSGGSITSASASTLAADTFRETTSSVASQSAVASSLSISTFTAAQSTNNITAASGGPLRSFHANGMWLIDDVPAGEVTEERREWDSLKLTFRVDRETLKTALRPLDERSGEMEVLVDSEGALRTYDRAGGGNSYALTPPYKRSVTPTNATGPWERRATFHVKKYSEKVVDQYGERYDVTLTLVPTKSREPDATDDSDGAPATREWEFAFSEGRVTTKRVRREVEDKAERGVTGTELKLILEPSQAKVLTESASYQGAVNTREVPDGENLTEDNSTDKRNSVYVNPPHDYALEFGGLNSGDYAEVSHDPSLDVTGNITVAFTAKLNGPIDVDTNNNYRVPLGRGGGFKPFGVVLEQNGGVDWSVYKGGSRENIRTSGGIIPEDGTVVTVICTHNTSSGESKIYVDGEEAKSGSVATGAIDTSTSTFVVNSASGSKQLNGVIDRVRLDARVWTSSEASDYNSGEEPDKTDARVSLLMDDGTGTNATDGSGSGNNATLQGNTSWVDSPTDWALHGHNLLSPGNYRVDGWEVEWQNDAFYLVNLTLKPVGDTGKKARAVGSGLDATASTL